MTKLNKYGHQIDWKDLERGDIVLVADKEGNTFMGAVNLANGAFSPRVEVLKTTPGVYTGEMGPGHLVHLIAGDKIWKVDTYHGRGHPDIWTFFNCPCPNCIPF